MAVYSGSRYIKTSAYVRDGKSLIFGIRKRATFSDEKSTLYTVVNGDTIDGIAYKQYGNAKLNWAILDANPSYLSELDMKPGDIIVIPSYEEVVKVSE